jgi:pimeloyl-ACP methyl ester carboxylesterase
MDRRLVIGTSFRAGSRFLATVIVGVLVLAGCGGSVDDPEAARCVHPSSEFGQKVAFFDHDEVSVRFQCNGSELAGTLDLPKQAGNHPAMVYVHGAGEATRWTWDVPWVQRFVRAGLAFFSYDKRGVGESEGVCCPGDDSHFNLLAADADGAASALRSRPEIDQGLIGFLGTSQAGWIVPLAVARSNLPIAFTALVDAPATTTGEERKWSDLAGEDADDPPALTTEKRAEFTAQLDPSGFDPLPLIRQMNGPGLWLYGGQDRSVPSGKSAATLQRLRRAGKDFTIVTFSDAGHGLLDTPPTDPRAIDRLVAWLRANVLARQGA